MIPTNDEGKFEIRAISDASVFAVGEVVDGVVHLWYGPAADGDPHVVMDEADLAAAFTSLGLSVTMTMHAAT
jgi:hypothetical protein